MQVTCDVFQLFCTSEQIDSCDCVITGFLQSTHPTPCPFYLGSPI